jgi:hypothetical protein
MKDGVYWAAALNRLYPKARQDLMFRDHVLSDNCTKALIFVPKIPQVSSGRSVSKLARRQKFVVLVGTEWAGSN